MIAISYGVQAQSKSTKVGDIVKVNTECFAATSEAKYDELTKASARKDEAEVRKMIANGFVIILKKGTKAKVLKAKFGKYQLNLTDYNKDIWVASEFASK
jgi:predicted transcriptional regulator